MKKTMALILVLVIALSSMGIASFAESTSKTDSPYGFSVTGLDYYTDVAEVTGWIYNTGNEDIGYLTDFKISLFDINDKFVIEDTFNDDKLKNVRLKPGEGIEWKFNVAGDFRNVDFSDFRYKANFEYNTFHNTYKITNDIKVYYNGEKLTFDVEPTIQNGRTLVPLRTIFEKMGAEVSWEGNTQTVTATKGTTTIKLVLGSDIAYVNGQKVILDVPATAPNGRTLVPLRFVSESMGCTVLWGNENKVINILK